MCDSVTTQLICRDLPWLTTMRPEQPPEEPLGCSTIAFGLEIHINHFAVLVDSSPQIMLLSVYLDENLVDEEGVTITSVFSFQTA